MSYFLRVAVMPSSAGSIGPRCGYAPPCMRTRPSQPMRVATSIAYTMSSELRPVMPGVGSADRIAIDVSERTNISRK